MKIDMKKRHLFALMLGILLLNGSVFVYAAITSSQPNHPAGQVSLSDGRDVQQAIDSLDSSVGVVNFGGAYTTTWPGNACVRTNSVTGTCDCPSGYTSQKLSSCGCYGSFCIS